MSVHLEIFLCIFSILYLFINNIHCEEILLEISQGTLRGSVGTNRDGGTIYSFQNIPYAQPPINELRFKAPIPANGWEGIRDATIDLPMCWQFNTTESFFTGQEDCLYLNVFTPEIPNENSTAKAVMVWIHGGAFTRGSAQRTRFGPEFLLTKDIVLVTVNYRVGIFGFLNMNDPELEVPGNAGMKDQVLALKWVQDNIERFGGDPNEVTIFGQSSGAGSVHLQMLSPMAAGLFNKVIAQSGCALRFLFNGTRNNGEIVARQLGIQTENWSEMLASLREVPAEELMGTTQIVSTEYADFTLPIIEEPSNEPAFLASRPIDIIQSGNYHQVPFMIGSTNAEALAFQLSSLQGTGENILIQDFTPFVPDAFEIPSGSEEEATVAQRIKEFYYGDTEPTREDITPAIHLYTDFGFGFPPYRSVLEHLKTLSAPIYFYSFSADTVLNYLKQTDPRMQLYTGAAHGDDLGYLFQNMLTPSDLEKGGVEDLAWRNMVNLWTNFAIYGNPTPDDSYGFVWLPVNENSFNFVNITTNITYSDVNPNPISMQFWYDLYEEYYPTN